MTSLLSDEEVKERLASIEADGFPPGETKRLAQGLARYCFGEKAETAFADLVNRLQDEDALVDLLDDIALRIWPRQQLSLNRDANLLLSDLAARDFDEVRLSTEGIRLRWKGFELEEEWRVRKQLRLRDETAAAAAVKVLGIVHMRRERNGSGV